MPEPRAALPRRIPDALRDFLRCRSDSAELEPGELDWLPKPEADVVPDNLPDPSASFAEGEDGAIEITVGWGFISLTLTATIADGKLNIESPSPLVPQSEIDSWVDDLNNDLADNGKQFDELSLVDGRLGVTKRPLAAAPEDAATSVGAPVPVTAAPSGPAREGSAEPEAVGAEITGTPAFAKDEGVWARFLDFLTGPRTRYVVPTAVLGLAAFFLFVDGGDDEPTASPPPPAVQDDVRDGTGADDPSGDAADTDASGNGADTTGSGDGTSDDDAEPGTDADTGGDGQASAAQPSCDDPLDGTVGPGFEPATYASLPGAWSDPGLHAPCDGFGSVGDVGPYAQCPPSGCGRVVVYTPALTASNHQDSVPDARTGATGLSLQQFGLGINLRQADVIIDYTCGSNVHAAGGMVVDPGVVIAAGPLVQFGPCGGEQIQIGSPIAGLDLIGPTPIPSFRVGPQEGTVDPASVPGITPYDLASPAFEPRMLGDRLAAARVVLNVLGGGDGSLSGMPDVFQIVQLGDDVWGWQGGEVGLPGSPGGAPPLREYWGLAASASNFSGDPEAIDFLGFGTSAAPVDHATSAALFTNTIFPCGDGRVAVTACPEDLSEGAPTGEWIIASLVVEASVPLEEEGIVYGFAFDGDGNAETGVPRQSGTALGGTDAVYEVTRTDGDWMVARRAVGDEASLPTAARAMIRNNSITLVAPLEEIGTTAGAARGYVSRGDATTSAAPPPGADPYPGRGQTLEIPVVEAEATGDDDGGEAAGDDPGGDDAVSPQQAISEFLEAFNAATAAGDTAFLFDRLHPAVVASSDETTCRDFIEREILSIRDFVLTGDVTGPTTREFNTPEGTLVAEEVYSAPARFAFQGETFDLEGSWAIDQGTVLWFTQCR